MESILIIGGTGKTGRRIAARLRAAGRPVRTVSRRTGFDLGDPATWSFDGVAAAYLIEPDLQAAAMNPDGRVPAFVAAAVAAGVGRFVLLSAGGADAEHHPLRPAEQAVRGSGAGWTVLRPTWFAQNFSEGPWRAGVLSGSLSLPTGNGRVPFVDAEDIAAVAVAALTEDHHDGRTYVLTGGRAISFGEATGIIGRAAGRTVRHVDIDPGAYTERQVADGVPLPIAQMFTGILTAIRDGRDAVCADGVERALGRAPRPFEEYVAAADF
ncbi:NmrA family NAD(P)-binding protein [Winogradskya humida]|nr:NAD(P)H-binding protein [Actinoplanes humidus]